MATGIVFLAPVFVLSSAVFIGLALPLIQRRVKPNYLYGLRIPATFADEWVWYEANARSGQDLLRVGIVGLAVAIGLMGWPQISLVNYAIINGVILGGGTIFFCIIGVMRANRLLKERQSGMTS